MSAQRDFDVLVVGGGHNGLTAAAQLARQGARVCVLERRARLGGMAAAVEALPGLEVDLAAEDIGLFRADLIDQFELRGHGLQWVDAPALCASPANADQPAAVLWCDAKRAARELERHSKSDARRLPELLHAVEQVGGELEDLLRRPPRVEELGMVLAKPELLRRMTASVADIVAESFETESVRAMLSALAVFGVACGPRAQGTGALLLYQLAGTTALGLRPLRWVVGGTGALVAALAASASKHGATIRRDAEVVKIVTERRRGEAPHAVGVELASGERLGASVVLSSLDLRRTLIALVGEERLELSVVRRVRSGQYRGAVSRLVVELDGALGRDVEPPPGLELEALTGRLIVAGSVDAIERAADDGKYGRFSRRPLLDVKFPALGRDSSTAGETGSGTTVLTINAQYAPFSLSSGSWDDEHREAWTKTILTTLEEAWPGVRGRVQRHRLWSPADWQDELAATEGSPSHGEMNLGQMFVHRPLPGARGCCTSIGRLLLCGAGAHPGGGVTGLPGIQAATRALELLDGQLESTA